MIELPLALHESKKSLPGFKNREGISFGGARLALGEREEHRRDVRALTTALSGLGLGYGGEIENDRAPGLFSKLYV
jgi:hypothetical protein